MRFTAVHELLPPLLVGAGLAVKAGAAAVVAGNFRGEGHVAEAWGPAEATGEALKYEIIH